MLGLRVDMSFIETVLNITFLLGVKVCLVNLGLSKEADREKRGNKSRMGRKVENEVLPEGLQSIMHLGGTERRGGDGRRGSIQDPGLSF